MPHLPIRSATIVAAALILAGCGDTRLDKLTLGISNDSVAAAMGQAPHRDLSYLVSGKTWELQLYARGTAGAKDSIAWRTMSPVALIDHKTVGWGWSWWDQAATKYNIGMPPKD